MSASIEEILQRSRTIAVVGLSPKSDRPSYRVAQYLQQHGYRIIPVHPKADVILGEKVYARLEEIPEPIDIVDVFRRPEETPAVAEAAVRVGAKVLWLQLGIENEEALAIARRGGLEAIQNRCLKIEHELRFGRS
ncbi:MAG: CoA-binding protein [Firmicutes bacterium]|nr:CoA-binding protein [Bacillota bacterium]